jgi:hypothetical protein
MSQIVACKNGNGIILAADSRALDFGPAGEVKELSVNRLVQLSDHSAILTGGAAVGETICRSLLDFVGDEKLPDVEAVYNAALPFLASQYEGFMRKACEFQPLDPVHHVHFILAGLSHKTPEKPYRMFLMWTKRKLPQLDGDEIGPAFTVPRLVRLEYRLSQWAQENAPLEQVLPEIRNAMERQAEIQEEIAGPFVYATLTQEGFTLVK